MQKFFSCFWGRPDELRKFEKVTELVNVATTFNLRPDRWWLTEQELEKELSERGLLYELNPDLKLEIPPYRKDVPACWGILVWIEWIEDQEKAPFLLELYSWHVFTPLYVIDRSWKAGYDERKNGRFGTYDAVF